MSTISLTFNLTAQVELDNKSGLYWGYFTDFPHITAIGETADECEKKLHDLFFTVITSEKEEFAKVRAISTMIVNGKSNHKVA